MEKLAKQVASSTTLSHLEQWKSLESFTAKTTRPSNYNIVDLEFELEEAVVMLDSKIREDVRATPGFDELSEKQKVVRISFLTYYCWSVILIYLYCAKAYLQELYDNRVNLSDKKFTLVESINNPMRYMVNYRPNFYNIIDSVIGGVLLKIIFDFLNS